MTPDVSEVAARLGQPQCRVMKLEGATLFRVERWTYYGWFMRAWTGGKMGRWKVQRFGTAPALMPWLRHCTFRDLSDARIAKHRLEDRIERDRAKKRQQWVPVP